MSDARRGALLVIEGLDRAGKSTQHARLCRNLESQGHRVKRMRFPGTQPHPLFHHLTLTSAIRQDYPNWQVN